MKPLAKETMALGKGAKIAIGCGVAALAAGAVVAAIVVGGAFWAKGKLQEVAGNEEKVEELRRKANATPFQRPADGVVREDRLLTFLEVRKRVFAVYEKHEDAIEARGRKKDADLGDVAATVSILNELRTVQAQALADLGMSEDEYRFMVEQVYRSMWAAEVAKATGGKSMSEAASDMYAKAAEAMEQAARDAKAAERSADAAGDEASERTAEDASKQARDQAAEMRRQAEQAREQMKEMDVPPANIALFRKHEADIKKYAMSGLELMGL